jgi:SEC-C motif-containing protein
LRQMNKSDEHDFTIGGGYDSVSIDEGFWSDFVRSPERQAQIERDQISYSWDELIEKFAFHAMTGTQYFLTHRYPVREQEAVFRFLAREPRTRRRMLSISLHEVLARSLHTDGPLEARVMAPTDPRFPHYVFLFLKRKEGLTDEEYRTVRMNALFGYCRVAKLRFPDAVHIIGIATEGGLPPQRSEDFAYLDTSSWSATDEANAKKIQKEFGFLRRIRPGSAREHEYPVDHEGRPRKTTYSRNSPCPCGSGKRYKRCHGTKEFANKRKSRR